MIRTLLIIASVSFVFAVGCVSGAIAVAGGPFHIGPGLRFERTTMNDSFNTCRSIQVDDQQVTKCRVVWTGGGGDDATTTAINVISPSPVANGVAAGVP